VAVSRRLRISAVAVLCAGLGVGACSLAYDLTDYSGGTTAKDSGVVDSDVIDSASTDTAVDDTGGDTALPPDDTDVKVDAGSDTTLADATDGSVVDSGADTSVDDTASDSGAGPDVMPETPMSDAGCGSLCLFGVSELMVRPTSGTGDKREWVELTNYDSAPVDVSGVTVKVFSTSEKATFTFPAGTVLAAGEAVVIADDEAAFKADVSVGYTLGKVFAFGMAGDIFVNGGPTVRVYAPGSSVAYETSISSKSTWTVGHSYAYPPPASACPATGRFVTGTGAYSAAWKETPADLGSKYGEYMFGAPAMPVALYGTPTKSNVGIACP
jgi:hypothetical protein